jgi:hypothetical protein
MVKTAQLRYRYLVAVGMEASFAQQYPRPFQSNQPRTNFMDPREQVTLLLRDVKNGNGEA